MNRSRNRCPHSNSITLHPELRRIVLSNPTSESLSTMIENQLFTQLERSLTEDILRLLPFWEQKACQGNEMIANLIQHLSENTSALLNCSESLKANLLRIRILSSTPGIISFPIIEVQEHLLRFLQAADVLADLPQFGVIAFSKTEIEPLASDLLKFRLSPHSLRYLQNLFHPERREAILSVLAYLAKQYPLITICRQSYALMLSLDDSRGWGSHPFCLRLVANRYWEYQLIKVNQS